MKTNLNNLPGDPTIRTILAHDATDQEIEKTFRTNPSSFWVITPERIIQRNEFFTALKLAKGLGYEP